MASRGRRCQSAPEPFQISRMNVFSRRYDAIANLPEREKLVLSLYYDEELNLKKSVRCWGQRVACEPVA